MANARKGATFSFTEDELEKFRLICGRLGIGRSMGEILEAGMIGFNSKFEHVLEMELDSKRIANAKHMAIRFMRRDL